jgi:hypothetical protein
MCGEVQTIINDLTHHTKFIRQQFEEEKDRVNLHIQTLTSTLNAKLTKLDKLLEST